MLPQILNSTSQTTSPQLNATSPTLKKTQNIFSGFSSQSISNFQSVNNLIIPSLTPSNLQTANQNLTLLDWIKSTDPQNKLHHVVEETKDMLEKFFLNYKWRDLQANIEKILGQIDSNQEMREIIGVTKRLQDLNGFLEESDKLLASQAEIKESFSSNLERAIRLKDESILKDLCEGHEKQLEVFKSNHCKMIELTNKMNKAKLELIRVIHFRLQ